MLNNHVSLTTRLYRNVLAPITADAIISNHYPVLIDQLYSTYIHSLANITTVVNVYNFSRYSSPPLPSLLQSTVPLLQLVKLQVQLVEASQ